MGARPPLGSGHPDPVRAAGERATGPRSAPQPWVVGLSRQLLPVCLSQMPLSPVCHQRLWPWLAAAGEEGKRRCSLCCCPDHWFIQQLLPEHRPGARCRWGAGVCTRMPQSQPRFSLAQREGTGVVVIIAQTATDKETGVPNRETCLSLEGPKGHSERVGGL